MFSITAEFTNVCICNYMRKLCTGVFISHKPFSYIIYILCICYVYLFASDVFNTSDVLKLMSILYIYQDTRWHIANIPNFCSIQKKVNWNFFMSKNKFWFCKQLQTVLHKWTIFEDISLVVLKDFKTKDGAEYINTTYCIASWMSYRIQRNKFCDL